MNPALALKDWTHDDFRREMGRLARRHLGLIADCVAAPEEWPSIRPLLHRLLVSSPAFVQAFEPRMYYQLSDPAYVLSFGRYPFVAEVTSPPCLTTYPNA